MRHQGQLHRQSIYPFVAYEAPEPFYAVQEIVLGRSHPAHFGSRVGSGQFGEARGSSSSRMALTRRARLVLLGWGEEGGSGVDGGFLPGSTMTLRGTSFEGWRGVAPSDPGRFRSFNYRGGYASDLAFLPNFSELRQQRSSQNYLFMHLGA